MEGKIRKKLASDPMCCIPLSLFWGRNRPTRWQGLAIDLVIPEACPTTGLSVNLVMLIS